MKKRLFLSVLLLAVTGFAGGVFSDQFLKPVIESARAATLSRTADFFDDSGHKRIDIGVFHGQAIQDLYGVDGKLRLQFGTYDGSVRMSEKGLPSFTLYDNSGNLKLLFRLDGPNQGPLIIMKDKTGTNRLIMGLDIWDAAEEPFLVTWDKSGQQHDIIGKFTMKPL